MAYQIAKIQDKISIQNAFINKDALQMCLDISIFLKMISARILALFFIFYCETYHRTATVLRLTVW